MHRVLAFKRCFRVVPFDAERVFLIGEHERFVLTGRIYRLVAPLLDGRRSLADIATALEGQVTVPEVRFAALELERKGYVTPVSEAEAPAESAFWQGLGANLQTVAHRLTARPVSVLGLGDEPVAPLVAALVGAGVSVTPDAAIRIVVTPSYLLPALDALNREALAQNRRWMLVNPTGLTPWIGPMFAPGGPCWACLAERLRINQPVETFLARACGEDVIAAPRAAMATSLSVSLGLAALLVAWWIVDEAGAIDEKLLAWDWRALRMAEHPVQRRPQCPACGDPAMFATRSKCPVTLEPRPRNFAVDGGFRTVSPEETYERFRHLISPITGLVSDLRPAEGRNHPLRPVYAGTYPVSPSLGAPGFDAFSRMSMGKGCTAAQSRASALCEALERQSARFHGDEPRRRARYAELLGEALHPHELQNFSRAQYETRDDWNRRFGESNTSIPIPFDESVAIDWSPAWSLTHARLSWVPTTYCFRDTPAPPSERFCHFNPNGHAAGHSLEEALLQGFLELVERDAVAIWWYNCARRPGIDIGSFEDVYFDALVSHYKELGWELWALDLTTDLGIPVFAALGKQTVGTRYAIGFGCHLDGRLSLQRALTELNQLFDPTLQSPEPFNAAALPDRSALHPADTLPRRVRTDFGAVPEGDLRRDVLWCVDTAARAGLETFVIDQTRPDIGLAAVKVIVPGLRHFWPRFGPGRLYDVPTRLGWVERNKSESELNPVHLFL